MDDQDFRNMTDAKYARRSARLLRFIDRRLDNQATATTEDQQRLDWLTKELIASRRGAATVARRQGIAADSSSIETSFSSEQALYRLFRRYSRAESPENHTQWVDNLVEALTALHSESALSEPTKEIIKDDLEPLLRRLAELNGRIDDHRQEPLITA